MRDYGAACSGGRLQQLPTQRGTEPTDQQRRRDPVAASFAGIVHADLRDAFQERTPVRRGKELGHALAPGLQARPRQVADSESLVRMRSQVRQVQERAVRSVEPRRIDDERVADLQRLIELALAEWRRADQ